MVARPKDARPDPGSVGLWSRPTGGPSPQQLVSNRVATNTDVSVWVGDAVVASLEQAGFRIERTENVDTAPQAVAIAPTINDAEAHFTLTGFVASHGEARVVVMFEVYKGGVVVFKRTFSGSSATDTSETSSESYRQLLNQAMREMLQQAIPTLAAVAAREGAKS